MNYNSVKCISQKYNSAYNSKHNKQFPKKPNLIKI